MTPDEIMAGVPDVYAEQLIVHQWRAAKALARRKHTSPKLRERLKVQIAELEQVARDRGSSELLRGWRQYFLSGGEASSSERSCASVERSSSRSRCSALGSATLHRSRRPRMVDVLGAA